MSPTDETLGAYVDGELDADARAELEAAMATQPALAARMERLMKMRARLHAAFDPVLQEPIPPRLAEMLRGTENATATASTPVTELAAARAAKAGARRTWSWPEWSAVAASITLGVLIGYFLLRTPSEDRLFKQQDNELLADGALDRALSEQLASTQPAGAAVRIGLSFRARRDGVYCRTFALAHGLDTAGIACRETDAWHVRALTRGAPLAGASGGAQQASSGLPAALLSIVQDEIDGEPLDAPAERAASRRNWRAGQ